MEVRTKQRLKVGQVVQPESGKGARKKWVVVNVRKLIPYLGEQKGYLVSLKEVGDENE